MKSVSFDYKPMDALVLGLKEGNMKNTNKKQQNAKNCGSKNCGNKNCGNKSNEKNDFSHGGNND